MVCEATPQDYEKECRIQYSILVLVVCAEQCHTDGKHGPSDMGKLQYLHHTEQLIPLTATKMQQP